VNANPKALAAPLLAEFLPVLADHYLLDENILVPRLLGRLAGTASNQFAANITRQVVEKIRAKKAKPLDISQLLTTFQLTSEEGVAIMCVAEALLRIPDDHTRDALIRDKISAAAWQAYGGVENLFQHFSAWALNLTGQVLHLQEPDSGWGLIGRVVTRLGEPVIRAALEQAMRVMGGQFVLGETIEQALKNAAAGEARGVRYSYDMLGEGARTAEDAVHYFYAYSHAIEAAGAANTTAGISIKLSALHPRYEWRKSDRMRTELFPVLLKLCAAAKRHNLLLIVDAEEMDRLLPSLELFEMLAAAPELAGWNGLGLAVQAYGKRTLPTLEYITALARRTGRRIPVRLVKGAYWDSEIKRAQVDGYENYPVFTRKPSTDVSYLACAQVMLGAPDAIFAQFATHNALTAATLIEMAGGREFTFQRLHGMGEDLYETLAEVLGRPVSYCIYAPVGPHQDLLAYLVRRLLENGANSSFVHQISDVHVPVEKLLEDPMKYVATLPEKRHPKIPLPRNLYGTERENSCAPLLPEPRAREKLLDNIAQFLSGSYAAAPIIDGKELFGAAQSSLDPSDHRRTLGTHIDCAPEDAARAMTIAYHTQPDWDNLGGAARAEILQRAADIFEQHMAPLVALIVREGGRTLQSAINDFREAADFLRYYGSEAARHFSAPLCMPGPTGERNELWLRGRGVFICIAPWNFPLAIFTGQVAAALAAGNSVIAKPAGQTPMTAHYAIRLLHRAGVPESVLHFTPGPGGALGKLFMESKLTAGIAFTGSTETGQKIYQGLAARGMPIVPFIAETGGQNCMIVDSTALLEQACDDMLASAFDSAGQRCSALRVAFVQEDIADKLISLLRGAAAEWQIGDPLDTTTDIGPVIDRAAQESLLAYTARMEREAKILFTAPLPPAAVHGTFFAPRIIELHDIAQLTGEVFGPVLHVIRYAAKNLDKVFDAINATGFGLTAGVHSRLDALHERVRQKICAGNLYLNRTMIGAVVGVQPFGGEGLSGTGPKAGGPHYLPRFATERTVSINTAAAGGNASLLAMTGEE